MKKFLLILLFLAACGRRDEPSDKAAAADSRAAGGSAADPAPASAASPRLTGLFEGGAGPQKNQLCIVEKGRETRFGLLVWGANLHSCSGAGVATREGERLRLRMTGDETCTIEAAMEGGSVTLPATLPTGCAYYCGARASLARARFDRIGSTEAEAKKATDIAGDPLCE
ncbi:MAG TPA: hypothetical protein VFR28_08280 [Allosphingosinicella sp.]|nr:hypothetical protein [Allosphingosinicella sp.]